MELIRVVLADDHVIVRNGIKSLLENETDIEVIGEASNGLEAIDLATTLNPDVLIMDIRMPLLNGIEATRKINELGISTRCLILTMHDAEEYVLRSIESGAFGYLLKDTSKDEFIRAIHAIAKGNHFFSSSVSGVIVNNYLSQKKPASDPPKDPDQSKPDQELTKRERAILKLIVDGQSNKDIATIFDKSVRTIETHRFKIMKKLHVRNVVELIHFAKEQNLV